MILPFLYIIALTIHPEPPQSDEIRVAVASNFTPAMKDIVEHFQAESRTKVIVMSGSTGKLYAQIRNGASVDAFFAADAARPKRLEREHRAVPGTRFTYAIGQLALWSPRKDYIDPEGRILENGGFRHLAIANPKLAPYGMAAREVLQKRGLWHALSGRLVRGENISQTFQFVRSGNAELGFVARSQIVRPDNPVEGSWWDVPPTLHAPIEQQAVLLRDRPSVRAFIDFVRSTEAQAIIRSYGYETP